MKKVEIGSGTEIVEEIIDIEENIEGPSMRESIPLQIEEDSMKQSASDTSFNARNIAKTQNTPKKEST